MTPRLVGDHARPPGGTDPAWLAGL
jgi:hypothetical protein